MSGSKTRLGFSGGDEPPPSDPEGAPSPRAARTVIGHELHLRAPSDPRPAVPVPPTPRQDGLASMPPTPREEARAGVPEPVTDETTEELPLRPSHTGKSRFPALARLFGRWTTGGGFLARSRMSGTDDDLLSVPREAWVSRVAIFVLAGLVSFLVALAVLKVHQCSTSALKPSAAGQVSAPPAPPAARAAGATPALLSAPPAGPPAAASQPWAATTSVAPVAQSLAVAPKAAQKKRVDRSSAQAAPRAASKPRSRRSRPDPQEPPAGAVNKDGLLPLNI